MNLMRWGKLRDGLSVMIRSFIHGSETKIQTMGWIRNLYFQRHSRVLVIRLNCERVGKGWLWGHRTYIFILPYSLMTEMIRVVKYQTTSAIFQFEERSFHRILIVLWNSSKLKHKRILKLGHYFSSLVNFKHSREPVSSADSETHLLSNFTTCTNRSHVERRFFTYSLNALWDRGTSTSIPSSTPSSWLDNSSRKRRRKTDADMNGKGKERMGERYMDR